MPLKHSIYGAFALTALWVSVWADGTITEVKPENYNLKLKVWTVQGNKYRLQCATNLAGGGWTDIAGQFTAELTKNNMTVGTEAKSRWFRVVEKKVQVAGPLTPPSPPASVPSRRPLRKS